MALVIAGLLGCLAVGTQFAGAVSACSSETSACVVEHDQRSVWRGRLAREDGRPATQIVQLSGEFPARGTEPVRFSTDSVGRYCVYTARETQSFSLTPLDPKFRRVELNTPTEESAARRPPGCTEVSGISWHHVRDIESTPGYKVLMALCVIPFVGLWLCLFFSGRRRRVIAYTNVVLSGALIFAVTVSWS